MDLTALFNWIIRSSAMASVLVVMVLLARLMLKDRIGAKWHYALWLIVVARLIMPLDVQSPFSIFNAIDTSYKTIVIQTSIDESRSNNFGVVPGSVSTDEAGNPENVSTGANPAVEPENVSTAGGNSGTEKSAPVKEIKQSAPSDDNGTAPGQKVNSNMVSTYSVLPLIWLFGAVILALYTLLINVWFYVRVKNEPHFKGHLVNRYLDDCKTRMGVKKDIPVILSSKVDSPLLLGFFKPKMLFPKNILEQFSGEDLKSVIMHELSHYKRKDIFTNWILVGVQMLHWFNPVIWYAFYRMRQDCEVATDAKALAYLEPEERDQYGHTLINLTAYLSKPRWLPATTAFSGGKSQLKRRITMIKLFSKSSYKWSLLALLIIVTVGIIGLTSATKGKQTADRKDINSQEAAERSPKTPALQKSINIQAAAAGALNFTRVNFSDVSHGWGLAGSGAASRVLRSEDGGADWTDVTPPYAREQDSTIRWGGYFMDSQTAWVALSLPPNPKQGTTVYRTTDGGKTWKGTDVAYSGFVQMGFNDREHGWLMLHQGAAAGSEGVVILTTSDGGASWQHFVTTDFNTRLFGGDKNGYGFADPQHGWITGVWAGNSVMLYETKDAGKSWSDRTLSIPAGLSAEGGGAASYPPVFSDSKTGVMPVTFNSGRALVLYRTVDGGQTWSATTPVHFDHQIPGARFSVLDPQHIVAADRANVYTTSDGGRHWQTVHAGRSLEGVEDINFATLSDGWAVLQGQDSSSDSTILLQTTDGGKTWVVPGQTGTSKGTGIPAAGSSVNTSPDQIHMLDEQNGYGWSANHPVMVTSSGGNTWTDVTPQTAGKASGAIITGYFTDPHNGWTFELQPGNSMTVYGTLDGGQSWSQLAEVPVKYGDGNMSVAFSDTRHGWFEEMTAGMGQLSGELFATADGGRTWQRVANSGQQGSLPFGGQLTAQKDGTLWLSGGQRAAGNLGGPGFVWLYKSTDGGKTWSQVKLPLSAAHEKETTSVSQPAFFGKNAYVTVLFQGGDSVLYASQDTGRTWMVRGTLKAGGWPVFEPAMSGWQIAGNQIYFTKDGGRIWQVLPADSTLRKALTGRFISQADLVDSQKGWLVLAGKSGNAGNLLLVTDDGGKSWHELNSK